MYVSTWDWKVVAGTSAIFHPKKNLLMLGLENVVDLVKKDFYSKKEVDPCYDFFYSSALTHLISLEIASSTFNNQCMSYELLCKKIPPKLGCRSTIYSTLNYAVSKGFFTKKCSETDKRMKT